MVFELVQPRVLLCGSRRWPWPETVDAVLDRLEARCGERLVVIEGAASGADRAVHSWCERRGLPDDRHRCHPVDWRAEREARPQQWRMAGPERNTRMLLQERPRLILAFHDHFNPASGGTSDMALRGLVRDVPVWLLPGEGPDVGRWLSLPLFPHGRADRVRRELDGADSLFAQGLFADGAG
ncbi:SLOG family protein [Amycolatopsis sp. NPDC004079]|uniref:SLOG family protein n=1 Tax=Amycolatopsis sp. NPDC004079 TaxID=3154549 RepID=UPI0033AB0575